MRSIYLTDYYNSGQRTEEEYNKTEDILAHSTKQQGQYRKINKNDNPVSSVPSSVSSYTVPSSSTPFSIIPSSSTSISSSVTSTVSSTVLLLLLLFLCLKISLKN